ncbi:Hypothetical protein POVN_LOCUS483 [uncultured virus]|nr:Hypothetical protein POVN_LOCUS483 [uncultured virus]
MDQFNRTADWSDALTVAEVQGFASTLGIFIPKRGKKEDLVRALLEEIRRVYGSRLETLVTAYNTEVQSRPLQLRGTQKQINASYYTGLITYLRGNRPGVAGAADNMLPLPVEPGLVPIVAPARGLPPLEPIAAVAPRIMPVRAAVSNMQATAQGIEDYSNARHAVGRYVSSEPSSVPEAIRLTGQEASDYYIGGYRAAYMRLGLTGTFADYAARETFVQQTYDTLRDFRSLQAAEVAARADASRPPLYVGLSRDEAVDWLVNGMTDRNNSFGAERTPYESRLMSLTFPRGSNARDIYIWGWQYAHDNPTAFVSTPTRALADRLYAMEPLIRPIIPSGPPAARPVPKPYTKDAFLNWLVKHPNEVKVNLLAQYALTREFRYGAIPVFSSYPNFELTPEQVRSVQTTSRSSTRLIPAVEDALRTIDSKTKARIASYPAEILASGGKVVAPLEIKAFPEIELVYDAGFGGDLSKGGLPRLRLSNSLFTWSTPPYGIEMPEDLNSLVIEIGGVSVDEYLQYEALQLTKQQARNLAYVLSTRPEITVVVNPDLKSPFDSDLAHIKANMLNFPYVMTQLFGEGSVQEMRPTVQLARIQPKRTFTTDAARWRLFRFLGQSPTIFQQVAAPRTGNLPFAVEDYISDAVWAQLPKEVTRYTGPVILVPNPYALLRAATVQQIVQERDVRFTRGSEATEMNAYDEIDPEWRDNILRMDETGFMNLEPRHQAFYLAARGVHEQEAPRAVDVKQLNSALLAFTDAGGIGLDQAHAMPLSPQFVNKWLDLIHSRAYLGAICLAFGIPDYELLSTDQIKGMFIRGHINPLPITKEQAQRAATWRKLTADKQRMLAALYGFPPDNIVSFVTRKVVETVVEDAIINLSTQTLAETITKLGFAVPPGADPMAYVSEALPLMRDVFTTKAAGAMISLAQLTDIDLLRRVGAYYTYSSRRELIDKGNRLLGGATAFFIPYERKCSNAKTLDYNYDTAKGARDEDGEEILLLGYGTLARYVCYQLTDLLAGFYAYGEKNDLYAYRIARESGKSFEMLDPVLATELIELVRTIRPSLSAKRQAEADELLAAIDVVNSKIRGANAYDKEKYTHFRQYPSNVQNAIREYFLQLFLLGFYQRRWRGPPNPLPMKEKDTSRSDFDHNADITPHIVVLLERGAELKALNPKAMEFVNALSHVEHSAGVASQTGPDVETVGSWTKAVIQENYCIRMASTRFIGSAAHYLQLFFGYTYPGYVLAELERIL